MSTPTTLVTGVDNHLLTNVLVRELASHGGEVRALYSGTGHSPGGGELPANCRSVLSDFVYSRGLDEAVAGVETLYHATFVLRYRARDPEREIVQPTLERTRRVLAAAQRHHVARVVLISCSVAVDARQPVWSAASWNPAPANFYERSRTASERLAWDLARDSGQWMTSVLPVKMAGPFRFGATTGSMGLLAQALFQAGPLPPVDPGFFYNWIDAREAARATIAAAREGRPGERYLLANPLFLSTFALHEIAREIAPRLRTPWRPGRRTLRLLAGAAEAVAAVTRSQPLLDRRTVDDLYGFAPRADVAPAIRDLAFSPRDPAETVREACRFLWDERRERRGP